MAIEAVNLRDIDKHAANVYEAIIVSAKRARQINDEQKIEFNQLIANVAQTAIDDDSEDFHNPDQMKISLEFEKRPKPHLQSLKQLLDGKLKFGYKTKSDKTPFAD
ncbi:MAG: DNA-directed RNA polymerase subunit omega [Ignavibacteria bacterium]|nr:DNA-directed RNA polymerase subunit omega [Ignavibacteria bacterium]